MLKHASKDAVALTVGATQTSHADLDLDLAVAWDGDITLFLQVSAGSSSFLRSD